MVGKSEPLTKSNSSHKSFIFSIIIVVIAILIAIGVHIESNKYHTISGQEQTNTSTSGWKTYDDTINQVRFQYPADWNQEKEQNPMGVYLSPSDTKVNESMGFAVYDNYKYIKSYLDYLTTPVQNSNDFRSYIIVGAQSTKNVNGKTYTVVPITFKQSAQGTPSPEMQYIFLTRSGAVAVLELNNLDKSMTTEILNNLES